MDEVVLKDLIVIASVLREVLQSLIEKRLKPAEIELQELAAIAKPTYELIGQLGRDENTIEPLEDILALLWQIAQEPKPRDQPFAVLLENLKALPNREWWQPLVYDALATSLIGQRISEFPEHIEWHEFLEEFDTRIVEILRQIDDDIFKFSGITLSTDERYRILHAVLFDRYWGRGTDSSNVSQQSAYRNMVRETWERRFRRFRTYKSTGKHILLMSSAVIDFGLPLNQYRLSKLIQRAVMAEGKSPDALTREIGDYLQALEKCLQAREAVRRTELANVWRKEMSTLSDVLKAVLGYIKITSAGEDFDSRVDFQRVNAEARWNLVDSLNEDARENGGEPLPGGAALTGALALVGLENDPRIDLLTPFISSLISQLIQQDLSESSPGPGTSNRKELTLLRYDPVTRTLKPVVSSSYKPVPEEPDVRNFVIEFWKGTPLIYCSCCGAAVRPRKADRVIIRNTFDYYQADGLTDRRKTQINAPRLKIDTAFGFLDASGNPLSKEERKKLADQAVALHYDLLLVSGLQSLPNTVLQEAEEQLGKFVAAGVPIHIEIGSTSKLDWLAEMLPRLASCCPQDKTNLISLSIGEELDALFVTLQNRERAAALPALLQGTPRGYVKVLKGLALVCGLGIDRLYIHDEYFDIILRKGNLSIRERLCEKRAALIAKWIVLRKLMSRGQILMNLARDTMTAVRREALAELFETVEELERRWRANSPSVAQFAGATGDPSTVELYGGYDAAVDQTVMLVPVRWAYGSIQDQLRIVGAGDTSSYISAALAIP